MIKTLDLQRNTTAILENAYEIGYTKVSNQIWSASFSLPINDPKVEKVKLLKYVEIDDVGLFRIIPKQSSKSSNTVTFQCEHVLATLLNKTLFKYHQLTNYKTRDSLQYLLDQQNEMHWKLGTVEFARYFHYSWENENLLSAIFSVPKAFDEQYRWTWDTSSYPWTLNLVKPETEPTGRIKEGHNLVDFQIEENPMSVINRIYPLGVGEGVNQLGIESVNNGIPYIEDAESIAENGVFETVWPDKRFEDAASLKANAEALLKEWKEPIVSWTVSAADVSAITGAKIDELKEGKIVRLELDDYPVTDLRIMKESKSDMKGKPWDVQLEIGSLTEDLGTTQADLERRQKVNELYSQGATNIDSYTFNDNADPDFPAVIEFPFPEDMINVNESRLRIKISKYRVPMRGMKAGGYFQKASVIQSKSTAGGGGQTTSSGGGQTTSAGGGTTKTTESKTFLEIATMTGVPENSVGDENYGYHVHEVRLPGNYWTHEHEFALGDHTHDVDDHTHKVNDHTHDFEVTIPAIEIKEHTHEQIYGIHELNNTPTALTVKIDGVTVPFTGIEGEIDVTDYLRKDGNGKVTRDYHTIEVQPNDLARINLILTNRFFVQSRIGGKF